MRLEAPTRLQIRDFSGLFDDLLKNIATFGEYANAGPPPVPAGPPDDGPPMALSTGPGKKGKQGRPGPPPAAYVIRSTIRQRERTLGEDGLLHRVTYGSPLEVVLAFSGVSATVVLTWLGVASAVARTRTTMAREHFKQEAYRQATTVLHPTVQEAVDLDDLTDFLAAVERAEVVRRDPPPALPSGS